MAADQPSGRPSGTDGECHLDAQIADRLRLCESCMRGTRLTALLLVALAVLATACGTSSPTGDSRSSLQASLRALATTAPHGDRAYWLGPEFNGAPVAFADSAWGRYALLTYHRIQDVDVDVESFPGRARPAPTGFQVRMRTATGQDVVLIFRSPAHPSAALVSAAKAALQPIPPGVQFPS